MTNNRYCEQCQYMNKSNEGYCLKMHCKVLKEKQTEQYIRAVSCIIEDWKKQG